MAAALSVRAISVVIPDVLGSVNATIQKGTASANDPIAKDAIVIYGSLKDAVESVQDKLDSDGDRMGSGSLHSLNDALECCRMLASALPPDLPENSMPAVPCQPFRCEEHIRIGKRVLEAIHVLCESGTEKGDLGDEVWTQNQALETCARCIDEDYQSLTLLLYDGIDTADQPQKWGRPEKAGASRKSFPTVSQLYSKLSNSEMPFPPKQESPETRRSKSIDKNILQERQQPWTRTDALIAYVGSADPFKHSLSAVACEDKQRLATELMVTASEYAGKLVDGFIRMNEASVPGNLRSQALELRALLAATNGIFTDEALDLFEYLWGFECFRSTDKHWTKRWTANAVLEHLREVLKDGYVLTEADVGFVLMQGPFTYLTQVTYGGRRVDIVDPRSSHSIKKRLGRGFKDVPTIIFVFDLTMYDEHCDGCDGEDATLFSETLLLLESLAFAYGRNVTWLIFLTGLTEFGEKLESSPLAEHIRGYTGANNAREGAAYMLEQMAARAKCRYRVRVRVCDLLDPGNVDFLFATVDHAERQKDIRERFRRGDSRQL